MKKNYARWLAYKLWCYNRGLNEHEYVNLKIFIESNNLKGGNKNDEKVTC